MNGWDILILLLVGLGLFAAFRRVRRKKNGCGCGCGACPYAGNCGNTRKDRPDTEENT